MLYGVEAAESLVEAVCEADEGVTWGVGLDDASNGDVDWVADSSAL